MKITALIMAGGRGERFWPRSRKNLPKQFLCLTDNGKTMLQLTVERINSLVNIQDVYIATNENYKKLVREQLPELPEENIISEPLGKNTAPCIGLGAIYMAKKYEDAIMMVLPSDHLIKHNKMFVKTLKDAIEIAEKESNLVTLGIAPTYPETGYGYIKFDTEQPLNNGYAVDCFVEKPNYELAKEYVNTGEYLWNSGMFVWKISSILMNIEKFMPEMMQGLEKIKNAIGTEDEINVLNKEFSEFKSESVDYGIMEKANHIYTIPGVFGWDDVGSWKAVERIKQTNEFGNTVTGNVITIDTKNCIIEGQKKLIATVGIENLVIVDAEDATLICHKNNTGDIKKILENLKICNRTEYI
ncbi:MAG: mannose-1-phosphate guanylyltransferase [Lachnospiraceae bacterium]|nr:mannose-1-phosphate guanylyltransferase [Lachnospiraceae bacterium]